MGHDIYGFRKTQDTESSQEIAYLRRGAFNPLGRAIYKALGAEGHDCGCSGCGDQADFTHAQLEAALSSLPLGDDLQPEREFLADCLKCGGDVTISFG